jgi:hypothetical protein
MATTQAPLPVPQLIPAALTTPPEGCVIVSVYGAPIGRVVGSVEVDVPADVPDDVAEETAEKVAPHDLMPVSWREMTGSVPVQSPVQPENV